MDDPLRDFEEVATLRAIFCDELVAHEMAITIRLDSGAVLVADYAGCVAGMLPRIHVEVEDDEDMSQRLCEGCIAPVVKAAMESGECMIVYGLIERVRDALVAARATPAPATAKSKKNNKSGGDKKRNNNKNKNNSNNNNSNNNNSNNRGKINGGGSSGGNTANLTDNPSNPCKIKVKKPVVAASNTSLVLTSEQEDHLCQLLNIEAIDNANTSTFTSVVSFTSDKRTLRRLEKVYTQLEAMGVEQSLIGENSRMFFMFT
jgi:hypothetical protein